MTLRDLTIDSGAVEEGLIEKTVAPYVRYDTDRREVVLLPEETSSLTRLAKIALYLLARRGWRYFKLKEPVLEEASPKEIAEAVRENRNTVRGDLQDLTRNSVIYRTNAGNYTVLPHVVPRMKKLIDTGDTG